jgi:hypothetical protein
MLALRATRHGPNQPACRFALKVVTEADRRAGGGSDHSALGQALQVQRQVETQVPHGPQTAQIVIVKGNRPQLAAAHFGQRQDTGQVGIAADQRHEHLFDGPGQFQMRIGFAERCGDGQGVNDVAQSAHLND